MTNEEVRIRLNNIKTNLGVGDEDDNTAIKKYWNHTPGSANDPTSITTTQKENLP